MPEASLALVVVLILVLAAEFFNGWTDAPNSIATVVSTRVLSPRLAVIMATLLNIAGAFSGTAVAATIGKGIIKSEVVDIYTVGAAMVAIIVWSSLAYYFGGLPTSESHALVAGLTGAGFATAGVSALEWEGWQKVLIGLGFSTVLGFSGALIIMIILYRLVAHSSTITVRKYFGRLQILSAAFMAFSHGSNDGQKFIGAFSLALLLGGVFPSFQVPYWVILICATTMGIGTAVGGWKIIQTLGMRVTRLEPIHGFAAETSAAMAIEAASRLGIPLSTTHTISTSIMGVGATRRLSAVRWGVAGNIVTAWILTFPACGAIGFAMGLLANLLR